jgi:hypothetical protein
MAAKDAAIRKRTQIAKANQTMFIWVAAVSVIVGFALVGSIFLVQKILFNEKVLTEKNNTISILNTDNNNVSELESQVRVLDTNQALATAKAKPTDQVIQVILDALPSEANSLALGASLQNVLLNGVSGLSLQSLQVDPVVGVESLSSGGLVQSAASATNTTQPQITFRFSVKGSEAALKESLNRLERSIRAIDIISLTIESQGSDRLMTVEARAFYEPARTVELKNKVVKS